MKRINLVSLTLLFSSGFGLAAFTGQSAEALADVVRAVSAPTWATASRIQKVVGQMENKLEWDLRRITLTFYSGDSGTALFQKKFTHPEILGVTVLADQSVHLSPRVTATNFDTVFAHELVHVILKQKYKDAIPKWLEEGLANHLANHGKLGPTEYGELAARPTLPPVRSLAHPFKSPLPIVQHYRYSRAALLYIASKCPLDELLQLSVGKKLENYLSTFCQIKDLDLEVQAFVKKKAPKV